MNNFESLPMFVKYSLLSLFCYSSLIFAQKSLPNLTLTELNGQQINVNDLSRDNIVILAFWATWCQPCIKELNSLNENLNLFENQLNSKLVTVSTDDSRTFSRIAPMINGHDWRFKVYTDRNQSVKRMLNIIDIPFTMLVYKNKIIYEHTGYVTGDQFTLIEQIKSIRH